MAVNGVKIYIPTKRTLKNRFQKIAKIKGCKPVSIHRCLSALEGERAEAIAEFRGGGERVTNGTDLWFQRQFIDVINTNIDKDRQSLQDIRQRILGTEARLMERHKDVRIMETYVDRLRTADFKERLDAEQLELDDVATLHCARGKRGGR